MRVEKLNQLIELADKYDYKPCASHFHNLSVFVGENASLISDLCKNYQALQQKLDAALELAGFRGAMIDDLLKGDKSKAVSQPYKLPDGYVLVPQQMLLPANAMEAICFHCGDGDHMFGEFTDGILWVGEIEHGDGNKTYGLNIATAEYPDEGSANISEFAAQLRAGEPS